MTQTAARNLKRTQIGQSRTVLSLMYRCDSIRKVVTMTALEDFILECKTINTVNRTVVRNAPTRVLAGTTLYFVASDDLPGWYYIGRVDHDQASCTCGAHQNHMPCKHQPLILQAHQERALRVSRDIAAEYVAAITALECDVPAMSADCPEIAPEMPTLPTTSLPFVSEEERRAFWQAEGRREHAERIARGKARWANFDRMSSKHAS